MKEKLKEKENVGALSVRNTRKNLPNCAQKGNKGITLVALIITIIVLLILAVVAIRAVQGDGIIQHAKDAKSATTVAQEKEQIQLGINEWQIQKNYPTAQSGSFKDFMEEKLSGVAEKVEGTDTLTVTMKDTGNIYTVKEDGTITGPIENGNGGGSNQGPSTEDLDYIETYFMGAKNATGTRPKNINIMSLVTDWNKGTFSDTNIKYGGALSDELQEIYVRYNQIPYKIICDENLCIIDVNPSEIKGKEGQYVSYNGITWIILYDDETNGLQMISAESLQYNGEDFNLGHNDSLINWESLTENLKSTLSWTDAQKREVDFDGNGELNEFEKAVYSYNNAITTLNTACESFVKAEDMKADSNPTGKITGVRCVGSNPINKNSENKDKYTSNILKNWASGIGDGKGKSTDNNCGTDIEQMKELAILAADKLAPYWLASRSIYDVEGSSLVRFEVGFVGAEGTERGVGLWNVDSSRAFGINESCLLRPVITLSSEVQLVDENKDGILEIK